MSQRSLWLVRAWPGKAQGQTEYFSDLRAAITWPEQTLTGTAILRAG